MEYRTFGRTGQQVSSLGFGGGPAGIPNYLMDWDSSSSETQLAVERAVRRALDRGITYFDTAPGYGGGISETVIGRALGADRQRIFLATKTPMTRRDPAGIRDSLETSLRLLQTEYVDLLQFHGAWYDDTAAAEILERGGLETYERLRDEGKVRFIGFTAESPNGPVERIIRSGRFDAMLITEALNAILTTKEHPEYQAALAGRGITDLEAVQIDPWPAGTFGYECEEGRRIARCISFLRAEGIDEETLTEIEVANKTPLA